MKKVLFDANTEKSAQILAVIEKEYLILVNSLTGMIKNLGIKDYSKSDLLATINRDFDPLYQKYQAIFMPDVKVFKTRDLQDQAIRPFEQKFRELTKFVDRFYTKEFSEKLPFELGTLALLWELDDNGYSYFLEDKKQMIVEGCKEFLEDPDLISVYLLHKEVADKLQTFANFVQKTGVAKLYHSGLSIIGLFEIKQKDPDDPNTGFSINPRKLDYFGELRATNQAIEDALAEIDNSEPFRSEEV